MWNRAIATAAVLACLGVASSCRLLGREYEYEEQIYLDPSGAATVVIDSSVPALVALRGLAIDPAPTARLDREAIRRLLAASGCQVTRIPDPWRRHGRRFLQIRLSVDDIRTLGQCALTSWSTYSGLEPQGDGSARYRQTIGAAAGGNPGPVNWTGSEIVGFKLHLPSPILEHNAQILDRDGPREPERGNILTWEQHLADRRTGVPIVIDVRMDQQSILAHTLVLFVGAFAAALVTLGLAIWWLTSRAAGRSAAGPAPPSRRPLV
jgi:hypothetical protein